MLVSDMCNFCTRTCFARKTRGKDDRVKLVCVTQKEIKIANVDNEFQISKGRFKNLYYYRVNECT